MTADRKTLEQLAYEATGGDQNNGVECPKCGCRHLRAENTTRVRNRTYRYRKCRHCGHKVLTKEEIVRDVQPQQKGEDVDSSGGEKSMLTVRIA